MQNGPASLGTRAVFNCSFCLVTAASCSNVPGVPSSAVPFSLFVLSLIPRVWFFAPQSVVRPFRFEHSPSQSAFPDVKPGLRALKQIGLRLSILSNGEPKMLNAAVQSAGIGNLIDAIVSVDSVKIFKPSPLVYDQLASELKIDRAEIGFVSANNWDVNGASSAGLTAFWIRRSNEIPEELGYAATRVIGAVTDLRHSRIRLGSGGGRAERVRQKRPKVKISQHWSFMSSRWGLLVPSNINEKIEDNCNVDQNYAEFSDGDMPRQFV